MNRWSVVLMSSLGLAGQLGAALLLWAYGPAKEARAVKPSGQRDLQGEDARRAAEQEKERDRLRAAGRFEEALKVAEAVETLRARVQVTDHWQTVNAHTEVEAIPRALGAKEEAEALVAKGRHHEAQPLLEQALAVKRQALGEEHPETADCYNSLALNLQALGKYPEAAEGFRKALAIRRRVLGEENPYTGQSYYNLAYNLNAQARYAEAEGSYRKALAIWRKVPGEEHRLTATSYNDLKWQPLAERLRRQRLGPLAGHLEGVRRLIVLPSAALAGVPMEVIAGGYRVSYAHSASMYAHLRRQEPAGGKGLFVLADPIFDSPAEADNSPSAPEGGVLLTSVTPGSNAARAGLRPNDVLLRYNGTDLAGPADFEPLPESSGADKLIPIVVWRHGKVLPRPLQLRPGKLGVVLAPQAAPQALAGQRRLDRRLASRGDDGKWDRLPGTRAEAAALRRLFGETEPAGLLLDSEASEQRLDELAAGGQLGRYRYLHLATHGEVDASAPLRSAVILARDGLPDLKQRVELLLAGRPVPDGRLTAEEVLRRWDLCCELVTLSACQTALGKYEGGEGFVGFAQALVLAGSRSVCLSLWKVDDAATALLMERFYQNLLGRREGLSAPLGKAEAKDWLRQLPREEALARAAALGAGVPRGKRPALRPLEVAPVSRPGAEADRPYAHPYYWAAFVLLGDPE